MEQYLQELQHRLDDGEPAERILSNLPSKALDALNAAYLAFDLPTLQEIDLREEKGTTALGVPVSALKNMCRAIIALNRIGDWADERQLRREAWIRSANKVLRQHLTEDPSVLVTRSDLLEESDDLSEATVEFTVRVSVLAGI